jgi:hypothetical protein
MEIVEIRFLDGFALLGESVTQPYFCFALCNLTENFVEDVSATVAIVFYVIDKIIDDLDVSVVCWGELNSATH